jgi:MATE family multidrug resistance protein
MSSASNTSYRQILMLAAPIILANSATPLLGLVDTAVIGNTADTISLGAIALGSLIFNFVYWGFGFLRMSTTGFVAQAAGKNDNPEILAITLRALVLGSSIGACLILLQWPIISLSLTFLGASAGVESIAQQYFNIRIWGAPATLATYVLMGYFIGQGQSRLLLLVQVVLNGLNIVLDIVLAGYFQMGAQGIALGTVLAEWITLFIALALVIQHLQKQHAITANHLDWPQIFNRVKILPLLHANGNLMIRTLFLLLGFAVFTDQGARFGDATLAANHILLQFISFSAFFLDGFAFASESLVGKALGAKNKALFMTVVKRSSILAAAAAQILALFIIVFGALLIQQLTDIESIRTQAQQYLWFCAAYVSVSFAAFQLDGLFIGTTTTRSLRNASVLSSLGFLILCYFLTQHYGNHGLWSAFIFFVILRALFLGSKFHTITAKLQTSP